MQDLLTLNDYYANYTAGLLKKNDLECAILSAVREDVNRFGLSGWSKDDYDDYISSLYPRMSRAIDTYREAGSSFETYIGTMVRLTAREYRSRQVRSYMEETAAWIIQLPELYACESEPAYNEPIAEEPESPIKLNNPRQLLILILKCYNHVSPEFLEKVSPSLGMEPETLIKMINQLKEQREKYDAELVTMREKINNQFYRCILFEKKLKVLSADNPTAQRLQNQLERGRIRLSNMRRRFARKRINPPNRQIAKLLGLSKSTVDAVLYKLKTKNKTLLKTLDQN
jgi:DNA-directed RNA polymerase specialized sigma24 family protein